jgi:2-enoate reductase
VKKISEKGVHVSRRGTSEFIACNTIILAAGLKADPEFSESFRGKVPEIYSIGDCFKPRKLKEAIEEGFDVGMRI